jgi:signal transduction histidine kinase
VQRSGGQSQLVPHIVDQIFIIGREALTNAFRHSGGTEINIYLDYGKRSFKLTCSDNGSGFDPSLSQMPPTMGHWGIRGMAERAERIGGSFDCGRGDEDFGMHVSVTIPARKAYRRNGLRFPF